MSILDLIDHALDDAGDAMRWTPPPRVEPYFVLSDNEREDIRRWLRDQGIDPADVPAHPSVFGFDETCNEWVIEHYTRPKRIDQATGEPKRYVRRVWYRSPPPPAVVKFVLQLRASATAEGVTPIDQP